MAHQTYKQSKIELSRQESGRSWTDVHKHHPNEELVVSKPLSQSTSKIEINFYTP
jgi:hypothetical protein